VSLRSTIGACQGGAPTRGDRANGELFNMRLSASQEEEPLMGKHEGGGAAGEKWGERKRNRRRGECVEEQGGRGKEGGEGEG